MSKERTAVYARISDDPFDEQKGVTDQVADCEKLAADIGWIVVSRFIENDTSAFKKRRVTVEGEIRYRVVRPLFTELLHAARFGTIDSIVVHDLDRMLREPRDLEDLIELAEHFGIEVRSVTGSLNLRTDSDVTMARVMVAVANKSSRDTARRVSRSCRRNAEAGRAHGGRRPFGYQVIPGEVLANGKRGPSTMEIVETEAEVIRAAATDVIAGTASLMGICRRWDDAGLRRVKGGLWREAPSKLRELLMSPRIAAVPVHQGKEMRDVKASWPGIITVEELDQLRTVLLDPGRRTNGNRPPRNSALSGLIKCHCGAPMRSTTHQGSRKLAKKRNVDRIPSFRCTSSETGGTCRATVRSVPVEEACLEALVREALEADLDGFVADPADAARLRALDAELAEVEARRADVAGLVADGALTRTSAAPGLGRLTERERLARAEREAITRRVAPAALLAEFASDLLDTSFPEAEARATRLTERFLGMDVVARRRLIPEFLEITVHPGKPHRPVIERLEIRSVRTKKVIDLGWPTEVSWTNLSDSDLNA